MFKKFFGSGSPEQNQGQNQGQGQEIYYENIRDYPGTNGELFLGELVKGGVPTGSTYNLVRDGKGGFRSPTDEETKVIFEKYFSQKNKK